MLWCAGLLISTFILFYLLIVPMQFESSPAAQTVDTVRYKLKQRLTRRLEQDTFDILEKTPEDLVKIGMLTGGGLGLIVLAIGFKILGVLALPLAVLAFAGGLLLTEAVFKNEYRMWQEKLVEGIPTLVTFVPSFLEVGGITLRDSLLQTLPFLPEPLKGEMEKVMNRITRTQNVKDALKGLRRRAKHCLMDSICLRLTGSWNYGVNPDIFTDLADQISDMTEISAAKSTTAKSGWLALLCVIGLGGAMLVYGYPGMKFLLNQLGGGFGI